MNLTRGRLAFFYIMKQMVPVYAIGVVVFLLILLMFQVLRLTEFVLVHGIGTLNLINIVFYMSISFLPVILPMSLLFTILFVYNRLSSDTEVLAFHTLGLNIWHLSLPALVLSIFVSLFSFWMSFEVGPWGNRKFEVLMTKLSSSKAEANIKEGTFSEFFDFVIYANKVDAKSGVLSNVFLFDERDSVNPLTIIAKDGRFGRNSTESEQRGVLKLDDGNIHHTKGTAYTKVDFKTYNIFLSDPISMQFKEKTIHSMAFSEISKNIESKKDDLKFVLSLKVEYHKRIAISIACLLFALVGVALGSNIYQRQASSGGLVVCIGLIVLYWILYILGEGFAKSGTLPPFLSIWIANLVFLSFGSHRMSKLVQ